MTNQKIGVTLDFKANTSQAQSNVAKLAQSLYKISSNVNLNINDAGIKQATQAAKDLSYHLNAAYNADTGKLDMVKLNSSLTSAKQNLGGLSKSLLQAGADGQQAFINLAKTIASAEIPTFKLNSMVGKLWASLKNVATWQISSSVLTGITSAFSNAYRFAEDLNESLTDIRIVTGANAEEMERFAIQANKAAKTLNTTTNEYAKASLIYFQQGLTEQQVKERTDLTIKMANVTGESAQEVSDQLTSIWNNFDDGSKSLEHYVDVITALGAVTASSTDEISQGLNKFAAVAETVGLSYEYAAAALATVTATTRQSADVVGTAFKTLFARIQDLELGNTLDDGTTMGQYSQALAAVGINIKDVNGEVKDMNTILDEMGEKWNTLNKDTQIALAQNVAGVRQYTQLIALMDNWSYFQENLNTAYTSAGALQEQSDIYAQGWEAARDKVTASLEDLYQDILDDEFFIDMLEFFSKIIDAVDTFVEGVGGIGPVILGIGSMFMNVFSHKIAPAMRETVTQFQLLSARGTQQVVKGMTDPLMAQVNNKLADPDLSGSEKQELENSKIQMQMRQKLLASSKRMSDQEKQGYEMQINQIALIQEQQVKRIKKQEELNEKKQQELKILEEQIIKNKTLAAQEAARAKQQMALEKARSIKNNMILDDKYNQDLIKNAKEMDKVKRQILKNDPKAKPEDNSYYQALQQEETRLKKNLAALKEERKQLLPTKQNNVNWRTNAVKAQEELLQESKIEQNKIKSADKLLAKYKSIRMEVETTAAAQLKNAKTEEDIANIKSKKQQSQVTLTKADLEGLGVQDLNFQENELSELQNKLKELNGDSEQVSISFEELRIILQKLNQSSTVDQLDQEIDEYAISVENATRESIELGNAVNEMGQKSKDAVDGFNPKHIAGAGESMLTLTSSISSAMFSIQGLRSAFQAFGDESVDATERLFNGFSSLLMILPSIITAAQGLGRALRSLATSHPILLAITIAASVLVGILATIWANAQKQKTALEKANEAYKATTKSLEAMNEQLKESEQHLEEVKNILTSYSEVQNTFDSLVQGSEKWNEALEKNEEIIDELLEKYPSLSSAVGYNSQGILTIDPAAMQAALGVATLEEQKNSLAALQLQIKRTQDDMWVQKMQLFETYDSFKNAEETSGAINNLEDYIKESTGIDLNLEFEDLTPEQLVETILPAVDAAAEKTREVLTENYASDKAMQIFDESVERLKSDFELFADKLKELQKQELEFREKTVQNLMRAEAQSIIQSDKDYYLLDNLQKAYVTERATEYLMEYYRERPTYSTQGAVSEKFGQALGKAAYGLENVSWDSNKTLAENFQNETWARNLLQDYIKRTEGVSWDLSKNEGAWTESSLTLNINGKDTIIELGAVIEDTFAKAAHSGMDIADYFDDAQKSSREVLAAYLKDFSYLSEEEMLNIGTYRDKTDRSKGFELSDEYLKEALGFGTDSHFDVQDGRVISKGNGYVNAGQGQFMVDKQQEIYDLQEAANNYNAVLIETQRLQNDLNAGNVYINQAAEQYDLDAETLQVYAKQLQSINAEQEMSYEAAAKMAVANAKFSKGLKELRDNFEKNIKALETYTKDSFEYAEAVASLSESLSKMFGVDVSANFIETYKEQIKEIVRGGEKAKQVFEELEIYAARDYVSSLSVDVEVKNNLEKILEDLTAQEPNIEIGADFSPASLEKYKETLNQMLVKGLVTTDQIQRAFEAIGWSPEFEEQKIPLESVTYNAISDSVDNNNFDAKDLEKKSNWTPAKWQRIQTTSMVSTLALNGKAKFTPKSGSSFTPSVSTSGSKSKPKKKNDEIERYHQIKETINDLTREYDRLGKARDRAFGTEKIKLFENSIKGLDKKIAAQQLYLEEIQKNFAKDREELLGIGASTDSAGRITNYEQLIGSAVDNYNAGMKNALTDEEREKVEENYTKIIDTINQYEESLNLLEDEMQEAIDLKNELFDLKFQKIEYTFEIKVDVIDSELKLLEYQLKALDDPIYEAAERLANYSEQAQEKMNILNTRQEELREIFNLSGLSEEDINNIFAGNIDDREYAFNLNDDQMTKVKEYKAIIFS